MTMAKQSREKQVERQKRKIERKIRRSMKKSYYDFCEISVNGLFEETVEWLNNLGYKVFLIN